MEPSDHLFRREAARMVATLTRIFGVHNLALAEDVVQDAFCRALEVWRFHGVPENFNEREGLERLIILKSFPGGKET